ncbi:pi3 pi4 protein kinase [Vairimorpha apis BRL 01]|uniref:Pi3 pi4 protein kinase n=1 Tax=Vairimorpha apis BRL 01 TaxID=1037528 RepID=T0KWS2_9MICR|nr:pi3 pi4 protein kinase [Vairimorpha apis BRL 01]
MGLGDRHSENILFTKDMHTVHVDLNCLFDKVNGFGVLGIHGTYTSVCIEVFETMCKNKDIIISNLLSFVYDPLHEWNKKEGEGKNIIDKLRDKLTEVDVQSKVDELNSEASDLNMICRYDV